MKFSAILPAAGNGSRMNLKDNKIFFPIVGKPMILHALRPFLYHDTIENIVIAVAQQDFDRMQTLLAPYTKCKVVIGGQDRAKSVYHCLQYLIENASTQFVVVHDAARPFLTDALLNKIIANTLQYNSAIPVLPATDSFILTANGKYNQNIIRANIAAVQTPQGFPLQTLYSAYQTVFSTYTQALKNNEFTDDSSIYAKSGEQPHLVQGEAKNKKITYIEDILSIQQQTLTGIGQDIHPFAKEGDSIVLGGVKIYAKAKLIAHSDGDVLVHAVIDALLSAAGLADIGSYFPNTDAKYKDCNSLQLLQEVFTMLQQKGYMIGNISISILAEHPKIAPYIVQMKENIAQILQMDIGKIGITATTAEQLGAIGRGEGIFVTALATITSLI